MAALPSSKGFYKWTKLSINDLPLIQPPRRHMLAQLTGGLTELFHTVKKDESRRQRPISGLSRGSGTPSPCPLRAFSPEGSDGLHHFTHKGEGRNKHTQRDDEGGGIGFNQLENEETSPYTDSEGEFCPENNMPLMASRYKFVKVLARGQSAFIIEALDTFAKDKPIAIKVLHKVYQPIGSQEADILLELHRADPCLYVPFARLQNQFIYGPHYCLVFEYLSPTPLYTHYEQKSIKGADSLSHIRMLCLKLLSVLGFLHKQNVIHADLKPENILLRDENDMSSVVVVDFGNALRNTQEELSLYYSDFELQTLLYRAPEVIFGLRFSLQIDLWSLGCLLAECYSGQPLFLGKTKHEILTKMTKLLGPFPQSFAVGECADEFKEFIGDPLSRHERIENLRKKLDCKHTNFVFLLEQLLTYWPDDRIDPYKATCHPFLAEIHPFLYMTSSGEKRYPHIMFDSSTYPNSPKQIDDSESLRTLRSYSASSGALHSKPKNEIPERPLPDAVLSREAPTRVSSSINPEPETKCDNNNDKKPRLSDVSHAESPINSPESTTQNVEQTDTAEDTTKPNSEEKSEGTGDVSRTDVKHTLKSMGLKCEEFTISVYSKEQAHAILRKQGVEVTNHSAKSMPKPQPKMHNTKPSVSIVRPVPEPRSQEDDDDCMIIEPPKGTKAPPLPPKRYPQQYQLLGTTVLVNRGTKRPNSEGFRPTAKRVAKEEPKSELSVQDTLKRLTKYNISITCRRNADTNQKDSQPESPSVDDDAQSQHGDEDLAKYLECQISEDKQPIEHPAEDDPNNVSNESQQEDVHHDPVDTSEAVPPNESGPDDRIEEQVAKLPEPDSSNEVSEPHIPSPVDINGLSAQEEALLEGIFDDFDVCPNNNSPPVQDDVKLVASNPPEQQDNAPSPEPEEGKFPETEDDSKFPELNEDEEINEELEKELLKVGNIDHKYQDELIDDSLGL